MSKTKDTKVPNVHLSDLKKIVSKVEQNVQVDPEITFEFIIAPKPRPANSVFSRISSVIRTSPSIRFSTSSAMG